MHPKHGAERCSVEPEKDGRDVVVKKQENKKKETDS